MKEKYTHINKIMFFKCGIGLCITGIAYFGIFDNYCVPSLLVALGVIFGFLGDVAGVSKRSKNISKAKKPLAVAIFFFMIGHFFFIAALVVLCVDALDALFLGVLLSAFTIPLTAKFLSVPAKDIRILGNIYIVVVCLMLGFALSYSFFTPSIHHRFASLFLIGAVLFWLSDYLLVFRNFNKFGMRMPHAVSLAPYYLGQLFISFSIFFIV